MKTVLVTLLVIASLAACSSEGGSPGGAAPAETVSPNDPGPPTTSPPAGAGGGDASAPEVHAPVPCGEFTDASRFVCAKDGMSRGKCVGGHGTIEPCATGCLRSKAPADSVCMGTAPNWSCDGTQGTVKAANGDYYVTNFGCWLDAKGTHHTDPGDNCLPGCFAYAKSTGLCQQSWSGPECEEKVVWFTANDGRFPCMSHLRIVNPANGRKVIAVVLDGGPACSAEVKIHKAMLDVSTPVFNYLFDSGASWSTQSSVHVVEVDGSLPLGIEP